MQNKYNVLNYSSEFVTNLFDWMRASVRNARVGIVIQIPFFILLTCFQNKSLPQCQNANFHCCLSYAAVVPCIRKFYVRVSFKTSVNDFMYSHHFSG